MNLSEFEAAYASMSIDQIDAAYAALTPVDRALHMFARANKPTATYTDSKQSDEAQDALTDAEFAEFNRRADEIEAAR